MAGVRRADGVALNQCVVGHKATAGPHHADDVDAVAIVAGNLVARAIRDAAISLGRRLGPLLVYQRHRQLLWAGAHVARALCAPLILEWNNSEVWFRANYDTRQLGRLVTPTVVFAGEDPARGAVRGARGMTIPPGASCPSISCPRVSAADVRC